MPPYRVKLDIFAGPLDLLLYLVRKDEVDVYDIPIAKITDQYLQYIDMLKNLDIDLVGDFLVMAATLMEIKSAMLLPQAHPEETGSSDSADPRAELVRQLLEYKRFKDAANLLDAAADRHQERLGRPDNLIRKLDPEVRTDVDLDQISIWDLLEAFDDICRATGRIHDIANIKDDTPIDLYQVEILHRLQDEGGLTFRRIFCGHPHRLILVGQFLALLELIRKKLAWVEQAESGELFVRSLTDENPEIAVQKAILASSEDLDSEPSGREHNDTTPDKPTVEIRDVSSPSPQTTDTPIKTSNSPTVPHKLD